MKKLFVSVPMRGRSETEIKASIAKMQKIAEAYEGEELELIDTYIKANPPENTINLSIWYLAKALEMLTKADVFIGIDDKWNWRGCQIESEVAANYGVKSYEVKGRYVIDNYDALLRATYPEVPVCDN